MQHNAVGIDLTRARKILGTSQSFSTQDQTTGNNLNTLYKFRLTNHSQFNLKLNTLGSNVDVELIQDRNRNSLTNVGETFASSRAIGSRTDTIKFNQLKPGTYYIRVFSNQATDYTLSVSLSPPKNPRFAERVFTLVNKERISHGLSPLALNTQLSRAAQRHSRDMALNDFFSHTGLNGSSPSQRVKSIGYPVGAGENLAAGSWTAKDVVNLWMNSSGHRANILSNNYSEIGTSYFHLASDTGHVNWNHYWTQKFSNPNINYI